MGERMFLAFVAGIVMLFKWVALAIGPVLAMGIVALMISDFQDKIVPSVIISCLSLGLVMGIVLAEYVRRRFGIIKFDGKLYAHKEIDGLQSMTRKAGEY
ncbi:hypothetical protein CXF86_15760 [Shewanella sp. GutCb]|uniref:hypothetical protein n=1 Tax=Shewanella sp. GutCb TaxID=2058315 RepID=UPI000C7DACCE|nr:hypothetical protein [Shewanella sp. GutCb]PKG73764.1 hypothetical protein CXF86_15760 [Shewanella sp. GutCb]